MEENVVTKKVRSKAPVRQRLEWHAWKITSSNLGRYSEEIWTKKGHVFVYNTKKEKGYKLRRYSLECKLATN
jgi:hypothetical protein